MSRIAIALVAAVAAFIVGSGMMLDSWKESAERGYFEVGHVLYKVERISP